MQLSVPQHMFARGNMLETPLCCIEQYLNLAWRNLFNLTQTILHPSSDAEFPMLHCLFSSSVK